MRPFPRKCLTYRWETRSVQHSSSGDYRHVGCVTHLKGKRPQSTLTGNMRGLQRQWLDHYGVAGRFRHGDNRKGMGCVLYKHVYPWEDFNASLWTYTTTIWQEETSTQVYEHTSAPFCKERLLRTCMNVQLRFTRRDFYARVWTYISSDLQEETSTPVY